jgi:hypothetical protein
MSFGNASAVDPATGAGTADRVGPVQTSRLDAGSERIDREVVTRFAAGALALGLTVDDRRRPADLAAARDGFTALTRIAGGQCDAWTGLAAAGAVTPAVIESVWQTRSTAGALQAALDLEPGDLGFSYDSGLYLNFRATDCDDFQLAYAATLSMAGAFVEADQLV